MKRLNKIAAVTCGMCVLLSTNLNAQWSLTGNAGTNPAVNYIGTSDLVNFNIRTNNANRITVTSDGKVGIGTTAPTYKLDIKDTAVASFRIMSTVNGSSNLILARALGTTNCMVNYNTGANPLWRTGCQGNDNFMLFNSGTLSSALTALKSNNNVGIGTDAPAAKLHVVGGGRFDGNVWVDGTNTNTGNTVSTLHFGDFFSTGECIGSRRTVGANQNGLDFYTNNINRMVLTNTGNLGVGNTAPSYKLDVNGTGNFAGALKVGAYTLPIVDGSVGQVLKTNGAGALTWSGDNNTSYTAGTGITFAGSTINSVWTASGNNIYNNNSANVGIGTAAPSYKLHVAGANQSICIEETGTSNANLIFRRAGVNQWYLLENFGLPTDNIAFYDASTGSKALQINQGGNVGIGTDAPATKLDVAGPGNWDLSSSQGDFRIGNGTYNIRMGVALAGGGAGYSTIAATSALQLGTGSTYPNLNTLNILGGQVGVGTTTPNAKLDVVGTVRVNDNAIYLRGGTDASHFLVYDATVNGPLLSGFDGGQLGGTAPTTIALRWLWNGNVGIGTVTPGYKLDVCGTIRAKEVRVESAWCDYVFAPDYKLKSIDEVDQYLKDNKHLPGIVPASEVENEGLKLGEMSKAMMEKIEELTLYVIQLNNNLKEKDKQINELQLQVAKLNNK